MATQTGNLSHSNNRNVGILSSNMSKKNHTSSPTYNYNGSSRVAATSPSMPILQGLDNITTTIAPTPSLVKNTSDKSNILNRTQEDLNISPSKLVGN